MLVKLCNIGAKIASDLCIPNNEMPTQKRGRTNPNLHKFITALASHSAAAVLSDCFGTDSPISLFRSLFPRRVPANAAQKFPEKTTIRTGKRLMPHYSLPYGLFIEVPSGFSNLQVN